ncbi:MAG: hypothetical protein J3R72DRAFT_524848 [Linnemannia gamsii]|nr:MAG: hypothetical protein J3R72DRAFT_524848 [Linnemannia gamsii]
MKLGCLCGILLKTGIKVVQGMCRGYLSQPTINRSAKRQHFLARLQNSQGHEDKAGKEAGAALDTLQSINAAFYWATEDRVSFAEYLNERDYHVVMCDTEADTRIATDCQDVDVVLSCNSDYMGYRSVRTIWRPVGVWNIKKCLVYSKDDILASLELTDVQLTALACVTKNDYMNRIFGACFDVQTLIRDYLQHPKVLKQNTDNQTFSNSIKVFVQYRQDRAPDTSAILGAFIQR